MDIRLKTNKIYATDKGVVKRIKYAGRTFQEVLEEIHRFAYLRGYNTPASILKFMVKRLGLPDVDVFPSEDVLTKEDILELSRALNMVDQLKDEFLSPLGSAKSLDEAQGNIILKPEEVAEIQQELISESKPGIWDDVPQSEEAIKLIYSFHSENIPVNAPTPRTKTSIEGDTKQKKFVWDDPNEMDTLQIIKEAEEETSESVQETLGLKVLFLGEQQVGVKSILFECNLKLGTADASEDGTSSKPFIYTDVVEHDDELVGVNVWTFENTQDARIPRADFFTGAGAAVLVYSVADRWSFDSLDFWIKELRDHPVQGEEDEFELPVTTEEGEEYCRKIAKELGENGGLHPMQFIEMSSVTGNGISELLHSIIDIWMKTERPSMPSIESQVVDH
jgi:Ras-related protein Rab-11A